MLLKDEHTKLLEERKKRAEEDRVKKEEVDNKKKEEQDKKKKENAQKKKEDDKQNKMQAVNVQLNRNIPTKIKEAFWYSVDVVLKPLEDKMDSVLGVTIDPFTDRHYITWLSVVTLAFNYNTWFITARLCFPYHSEFAIPFWLATDTLADLIYLTDAILFQPRRQFVQGGDIIVSLISFSRS